MKKKVNWFSLRKKQPPRQFRKLLELQAIWSYFVPY